MTIDDQMRYERKFVTVGIGALHLRTVLRCHPALFSEAYPPRDVNNVYFEMPDRRNYVDSIEGSRDRTKIRIRWYGETFGRAADPRLECKIKRGLVGFKRRFDLVPLDVPEDLEPRRLRQALRRSELPPDVTDELAAANAVLLNSYRRAYFISADRRFRITIDERLRTYDLGRRDLRPSRNRIDGDPLIVELKYDVDAEDDVHRVTGALPLRLSKSSKYVTGMNELFLW